MLKACLFYNFFSITFDLNLFSLFLNFFFSINISNFSLIITTLHLICMISAFSLIYKFLDEFICLLLLFKYRRLSLLRYNLFWILFSICIIFILFTFKCIFWYLGFKIILISTLLIIWFNWWFFCIKSILSFFIICLLSIFIWLIFYNFISSCCFLIIVIRICLLRVITLFIIIWLLWACVLLLFSIFIFKIHILAVISSSYITFDCRWHIWWSAIPISLIACWLLIIIF